MANISFQSVKAEEKVWWMTQDKSTRVSYPDSARDNREREIVLTLCNWLIHWICISTESGEVREWGKGESSRPEYRSSNAPEPSHRKLSVTISGKVVQYGKVVVFGSSRPIYSVSGQWFHRWRASTTHARDSGAVSDNVSVLWDSTKIIILTCQTWQVMSNAEARWSSSTLSSLI